MKIIACTILHYGIEWLHWSMRSVEDFVDEHRIYYTPKPSHGHQSGLQCPESREELKAVADSHGAYWHDGVYAREGDHRDFAYKDCMDNGADAVLVVDADEVWPPEVLQKAIAIVEDAPRQNYCVNMIHFWRSLSWACSDNMFPLRIVVPNATKEAYLSSTGVGRPLHMGYAQSKKIIEYKISIHGHKNEFVPHWFNQVFALWKPPTGDVHPTCARTWYPDLFARKSIYDLVGDHPYYDLDIIE